ncbi:MAG: hypothetical protein IPN74_20230 [Haliscomenobacter sp.]|nr:hypothetical protein [Haliscomenobacter sp.]
MGKLNQLSGVAKDSEYLFLFAENTAKAELDLSALSNRRAKIAENLEKFRKSVEVFFGTGDIEDVISFLNSSPEMFRRDCIHRYMEKSKMPKEIDLEAFSNSLTSNPPEMEKVISAHAAARDPLSEDPLKYFQQGEFKFLPLSFDEKGIIRERAKDYVADQETADAYRHILTVCTLFNRLPASHRTSKDRFHELPAHVKPYINCTGSDNWDLIRLSNPAVFMPKDEMFIIQTEAKTFVAFDEK